MFGYTLINIPENFELQEEILKEIFHSIALAVKKPQNGIINIGYIDDDEMQKLNREYRQIDSTTDVLSFHYFDDFSTTDTDEIAGEILLSESKVRSQGREHGHTPEKESAILILHGLLHILGYDHETDDDYSEMWDIESLLREKIG